MPLAPKQIPGDSKPCLQGNLIQGDMRHILCRNLRPVNHFTHTGSPCTVKGDRKIFNVFKSWFNDCILYVFGFIIICAHIEAIFIVVKCIISNNLLSDGFFWSLGMLGSSLLTVSVACSTSI